MKKIFELINPSPTLPLSGEGVKLQPSPLSEEAVKLQFSLLLGEDVKIDKGEKQTACALLNIVATPLNNAQPWRLFLLHYLQEMERTCL